MGRHIDQELNGEYNFTSYGQLHGFRNRYVTAEPTGPYRLNSFNEHVAFAIGTEESCQNFYRVTVLQSYFSQRSNAMVERYSVASYIEMCSSLDGEAYLA